MTVLFIGDKPSNNNIDPKIPFVGTQSYKRLLNWIWELNLDINYVVLINKDDFKIIPTTHFNVIKLTGGRCYFSDGIHIIALGNKASNHLDKFKLQYFKLPHPSGRNRLLNNPKFIKDKLKECSVWLSNS